MTFVADELLVHPGKRPCVFEIRIAPLHFADMSDLRKNASNFFRVKSRFVTIVPKQTVRSVVMTALMSLARLLRQRRCALMFIFLAFAPVSLFAAKLDSS